MSELNNVRVIIINIRSETHSELSQAFNTFLANVSILYPLKTSKKAKSLLGFSGDVKWPHGLGMG